MLKIEIKKEIKITNKEIAHFLFVDGSLLDHMDETLENILYDEYKIDYATRCDAVEQLTIEDYVEILKMFVDELDKD